MPNPNAVRVHLVLPRSFNDAQQIADKFKQGIPVILNLQSADTELSKRLIDFASGLTYALNGGMQRVADKVFLLTPRNVEVSAEQRAQLLERGGFYQPSVATRRNRAPAARRRRGAVLDTITQVELFVDRLHRASTSLLIFVYVLASWFRLPYSLNPIQRFLHDVCEPYLRLWRRILPSFGPLDFSPMVAIIASIVARRDRQQRPRPIPLARRRHVVHTR